jgi:hypothetical protein
MLRSTIESCESSDARRHAVPHTRRVTNSDSHFDGNTYGYSDRHCNHDANSHTDHNTYR